MRLWFYSLGLALALQPHVGFAASVSQSDCAALSNHVRLQNIAQIKQSLAAGMATSQLEQFLLNVRTAEGMDDLETGDVQSALIQSLQVNEGTLLVRDLATQRLHVVRVRAETNASALPPDMIDSQSHMLEYAIGRVKKVPGYDAERSWAMHRADPMAQAYDGTPEQIHGGHGLGKQFGYAASTRNGNIYPAMNLSHSPPVFSKFFNRGFVFQSTYEQAIGDWVDGHRNAAAFVFLRLGNPLIPAPPADVLQDPQWYMAFPIQPKQVAIGFLAYLDGIPKPRPDIFEVLVFRNLPEQ